MNADRFSNVIIPCTGHDFQWVSPYSVEECGRLLEQCSRRDNWFAQRDLLRVIVSLESYGVLRFVMDVDAIAGNRLDVTGFLVEQTDGRTLVTGSVFIRPFVPGMGWLAVGTKYYLLYLIYQTLVPPDSKHKPARKKAA